jgi:hypothetical protein
MRERDSRGNNCELLGDGSNPTRDHAHEGRTTPQQQKAKVHKIAREDERLNATQDFDSITRRGK